MALFFRTQRSGRWIRRSIAGKRRIEWSRSCRKANESCAADNATEHGTHRGPYLCTNGCILKHARAAKDQALERHDSVMHAPATERDTRYLTNGHALAFDRGRKPEPVRRRAPRDKPIYHSSLPSTLGEIGRNDTHVTQIGLHCNVWPA